MGKHPLYTFSLTCNTLFAHKEPNKDFYESTKGKQTEKFQKILSQYFYKSDPKLAKIQSTMPTLRLDYSFMTTSFITNPNGQLKILNFQFIDFQKLKGAKSQKTMPNAVLRLNRCSEKYNELL
jgi:hypothetical protein